MRKAAWDDLSGKLEKMAPIKINVTDLIAAGEGDEIEFKSTLRTNLHTGQTDEKMHLAVLKTITGFLNAKGGTLLIGVADSGEVLGLDADNFANEDKMGLHLVNLLKDRVGEVFLPYVHYRFETQDGQRTLLVLCDKGPKPAFVKDGALQRFFCKRRRVQPRASRCLGPRVLHASLLMCLTVPTNRLRLGPHDRRRQLCCVSAP